MVKLLGRDAPTPEPKPVAPDASASVTQGEELAALEARVTELAMEVAELRAERRSSERVDGAPEEASIDPESELSSIVRAMESQLETSDGFRDQIVQVMGELEAEKEALEFEEELEERRKEAVRANREYDRFETELEPRLSGMQEKLGLDGRQTSEMRSLLALQNDRNREMTRLWSGGETSDEDLERMFAENRAAHRAEVIAILGTDQLGRYKKLVADGGLGGRFSFFTGPWEDWAE